MKHWSHLAALLALLGLILLSRGAFAAPATAPASTAAPASLFDRLVAEYFAGKWEELSADLTANLKETSALPPAQKADVDYIRKTLAESRPAWWKLTKAGAPIRFRPTVWTQSLNATFQPENAVDPEHKQNIQLNYVNGVSSVIVRWNAGAMDDPTPSGELKFTKGEELDISLWNTLGTAAAVSNIPLRMLANLNDEKSKQQLNFYREFRGFLTAAYYTTPRARRYVIWQSVSAWSHEYDNKPGMHPHKIVAVILTEEVLAHPEIYKTIPRPKEPPADGAESKIIWELQEWLRFHDMSLSEDKAFREALKSFATANELKAKAAGKATLQSGLFFALDPAPDKPLSLQRDAWIKAQYAKGK